MPDSLKVMIIDDEPPARRRFRNLIDQTGGAEVIAEAGSLSEARQKLALNHPDALFLDIQLFAETAFDLLPGLPPEICVIFITAHPDFALDAYDHDILDYLLKPVQPERLTQTIRKIHTRKSIQSNFPPHPDSLWIGDHTCRKLVPVSTITAIGAEGTYSRVFLTDGSNCLMLRPLKQWQKILAPFQFLRVDRSLLINLTAVRSFHIQNRDQASIELVGSPSFHLGRTAIRRIRKQL